MSNSPMYQFPVVSRLAGWQRQHHTRNCMWPGISEHIGDLAFTASPLVCCSRPEHTFVRGFISPSHATPNALWSSFSIIEPRSRVVLATSTSEDGRNGAR